MGVSARPRDHILALTPYELSPGGGKQRLIRLDQNEQVGTPSPAASEAARRALSAINRYPEGSAAPLRSAIAEAENLTAERILCGAGSMELLGLLAQAYLRPGDDTLISRYGYLYFRTAAAISGANVVLAPEIHFRAAIDELLNRVTPRTRILFLANPNNPTGSLIGRQELERLRAELREDVILVLDGAYAEYVDDSDYDSGARLVDAVPNTVMLRSFSKLHGLAGLRVGWGYFPADIADILNRVRHPNAVSGPAIAAAAAAIGDRSHAAAVRRANAARRDRLFHGLRDLGLLPYPGHGNFLLLSFETEKRAGAAYLHLRRAGILLRPMAGYGLGHCLRVTVGTEAEIEALLSALDAWRQAGESP